MQSLKEVTHINGVDVSDYHPVRLSKDKFINIKYEQYPKEYSHILIHALQFQHPIPSIKSMERTEKRNKAKALKGKDSEQKQPGRSANRKMRGRKRVPRGLLRQLSNSSLIKPLAQKKATTNHIKVRSPEWIALKTARQQCQEQFQTWASLQSGNNESESDDKIKVVKSELPMYFKKKNESHSRRIKQRWQLIKANREKLIQIYGYEILHKGCRVGIKDIKDVLGLVDNGMQAEEVRDFMEMAEESSGSSSSSSSSVPHS